MTLLRLLFQAAVAGPFLPSPARPREVRPCPVGEGDDVVVCAPDQSQLRLGAPPRAEAARDGPPRAVARVGRNATLFAEAEQGGVGGIPSRRAVVKLRLGL